MLNVPYPGIWRQLNAGQVVPFLGAGASLVGRRGPKPWTGLSSSCLPTAGELADFLATESMFPSKEKYDRSDLAKVSSYYAEIMGRTRLRQLLREVLNRDLQPGPLHRLLAGLTVNLIIVSTNYDTLIEQAFQEAGKPYDLVVYPTDNPAMANAVMWWRHGKTKPDFVAPNSLAVDLTKKSLIYKMHGTVVPKMGEFDSYVVTEDDYVEFLSRMSSAVPKLLLDLFRTRSFLFLGYGLRDWNLRVVLKNVSRHLINRRDEDLPSWAIQLHPSELERVLWERRKVFIFDVDLQSFVTKLQGQDAASAGR
jgi:hypothetical protein